MTRRWRGTALFGVVLASLGAALWAKTTSAESATVAEKPKTSQSPSSSASASKTKPSSSTSSSSSPSRSPNSSPSSTSASTSPTSSATASATSPGNAVVDGNAVDTPYGPVEVEVTWQSGSITKVDLLQYPSGSGRDIAINQYALPILAQEVIQSQSAQINTVSGATFTSIGYIQSLQSAIDKKG
ncbi:FMN-binding protein [Gryllotalpicola sp.]|uniref:FMN-binding protein n=1 Tax=Gryllotalpicola sp. TaxID=1932787 RepID=UPI00260B2962|nr:FMN-binding protein [Gryllotalpicola sp.]